MQNKIIYINREEQIFQKKKIEKEYQIINIDKDHLKHTIKVAANRRKNPKENQSQLR